MCGRFVSPEVAEVERAWAYLGSVRTLFTEPYARNFNTAPTATVPIIHRDRESDEFLLVPAAWGLIPIWWKEAKAPKFTFNARLEEAASKPMWKPSLATSRCLVPAFGWYEWQQVERVDPATGEIKKAKQPHFIQNKNGTLLWFAGLMCRRKTAEGTASYSCTVITTAAAPTVSGVHDRMPVSLPNSAVESWLDRTVKDAERAATIAREHMQTDFAYHPVADRVSNARNTGPSLCEPLAGVV